MKDPIIQQGLGLYKKYKRNARRHGHVFQLTFKYFLTITSARCSYCGIPPIQVYSNNPKTSSMKYIYNGVDRKNSSKGYTKGNVTACCVDCNFFKADYDLREFIQRCERIARYHKFRNHRG